MLINGAPLLRELDREQVRQSETEASRASVGRAKVAGLDVAQVVLEVLGELVEVYARGWGGNGGFELMGGGKQGIGVELVGESELQEDKDKVFVTRSHIGRNERELREHFRNIVLFFNN